MPASLAETKRMAKLFLNRCTYDLEMDEMTLHRKKKLKELIGLPPFNGSNLEFSKAIGKSKGRVTQMLDPDEPFGENAARAICEARGLPPRYFEQDFGADTPNVTELDPQRTRVPLISSIQAGEMSDVWDLFHPGEAVQWEDAYKSNPGKHSYALLVEGDSMVSQVGAHSFQPGTILIVDPERGANAGDYVIAKDVQTQKATFKQLTTDGSRWYLKPLNPQYPTIEIDDPSMRVIGRVIEAKPPSLKL